MVAGGMDRSRGRPMHNRESRFDANKMKREPRQEIKHDDKKDVKDLKGERGARDRAENGSEKGDKKTQPKLVVDSETGQKKFTGRCRLFVGNIPNDIKEDEFKEMFKPHGDVSEVFLNPSRGFGFIRLDTREHAEKAKAALDGLVKKGRTLRIRFATHGAALKVKYLPAHVSNELLEEAFTQFGDVERAVVIVDDRGKSTGEGIVEFARKPGALAALKQITNGAFIMGTTPRPIAVEALEQKDDEDGNPEKFINKTPEFLKEREQAPRFGPPGSFEYDFCQKWKELYRMEEEQKKDLERQMEEACLKLEMEMEHAAHEHQAMLLRQDLVRRQEELQRLEEQHRQELQRRMEQKQLEFEMRRREMERFQQGGSGIGGSSDRGMGSDDRRRSDMDRRNADLYASPQGMGNMSQHGMRQSRFDQPPASTGGFGGNQMQGMQGQQMMGSARGASGGASERMMEQRGAMERGASRGGSNDRRPNDDFFDAKRPRRF